MIFFAVRFSIGKYCSKILSSRQFVKLNFVGDAVCSLGVVILATLNMVKLNLGALTTNHDNFILINFISGAFSIMAEVFAFKAIE